MNVVELAAKLSGGEYPFDVSVNLAKQAQADGLVVVFGASDDLMEFRGAISDEIGAYEGTVAYVDSEGLQPQFDQIETDRHDSKDKLREFFRRENRGVPIEAKWCAEPGYSWTFETLLPHATFEIMENGEHYCRGIVFSLIDAHK